MLQLKSKSFIRNSRKLNESYLQHEILDYLNKSGTFAFRLGSHAVYDAKKGIFRKPGKFEMPGRSDIVGVAFDGKILCVEVKIDNNKPTDAQRAFLMKVHQSGGYATVVWSLDQMIVYLREIKHGERRCRLTREEWTQCCSSSDYREAASSGCKSPTDGEILG